MYQLFCDSNCELWYTTVAELGLNVIKMPYTLNDKEYFYDMGEHTDFKAFFDAMRAGAVPKTSALNEYAYTEYFEPVLARGEDIYYVTFSHKMSTTFNAMDAAIAKLKNHKRKRYHRNGDPICQKHLHACAGDGRHNRYRKHHGRIGIGESPLAHIKDRCAHQKHQHEHGGEHTRPRNTQAWHNQ